MTAQDVAQTAPPPVAMAVHQPSPADLPQGQAAQAESASGAQLASGAPAASGASPASGGEVQPGAAQTGTAPATPQPQVEVAGPGGHGWAPIGGTPTSPAESAPGAATPAQPADRGTGPATTAQDKPALRHAGVADIFAMGSGETTTPLIVPGSGSLTTGSPEAGAAPAQAAGVQIDEPSFSVESPAFPSPAGQPAAPEAPQPAKVETTGPTTAGASGAPAPGPAAVAPVETTGPTTAAPSGTPGPAAVPQVENETTLRLSEILPDSGGRGPSLFGISDESTPQLSQDLLSSASRIHAPLDQPVSPSVPAWQQPMGTPMTSSLSPSSLTSGLGNFQPGQTDDLFRSRRVPSVADMTAAATAAAQGQAGQPTGQPGQAGQPGAAQPGQYGQFGQPIPTQPSQFGQPGQFGQPIPTPPSQPSQFGQPIPTPPSQPSQFGQPIATPPGQFGQAQPAQFGQPIQTPPGQFGQPQGQPTAQDQARWANQFGQPARPDQASPGAAFQTGSASPDQVGGGASPASGGYAVWPEGVSEPVGGPDPVRPPDKSGRSSKGSPPPGRKPQKRGRVGTIVGIAAIVAGLALIAVLMYYLFNQWSETPEPPPTPSESATASETPTPTPTPTPTVTPTPPPTVPARPAGALPADTATVCAEGDLGVMPPGTNCQAAADVAKAIPAESTGDFELTVRITVLARDELTKCSTKDTYYECSITTGTVYRVAFGREGR